MARLIVTIKDPTVLEKINSLPKLVRGRMVEQAITQYIDSPEGAHLFKIFGKRDNPSKNEKKNPQNPVRQILGGFSEK